MGGQALGGAGGFGTFPPQLPHHNVPDWWGRFTLTNSRPRSWLLHRTSIQHPASQTRLRLQTGSHRHSRPPEPIRSSRHGNGQTSIAREMLRSQPTMKKQPFGATILHFRPRRRVVVVCLTAHSCAGYLSLSRVSGARHSSIQAQTERPMTARNSHVDSPRGAHRGEKGAFSCSPDRLGVRHFMPLPAERGADAGMFSQQYQSGERPPRDQHLCLHGDGCPEALSQAVDRVWAGSEIRLGAPVPSSTLTSWSGPSLGVWGTDLTVWAQLPRLPVYHAPLRPTRSLAGTLSCILKSTTSKKFPSLPSWLFLDYTIILFLAVVLSCPLEGLISIHYPQGSENPLFFSFFSFLFPFPPLLALTVGTPPNLRPTFLFSGPSRSRRAASCVPFKIEG